MKERLIELMQILNCTPTQFANAIGIQRATLQHILNGRNEPSLKIVMAIHNSFPQVDIEWLLNGTGNAFGETSGVKPASQDLPLFPGMESAIIQTNIQDKPGFSNLKEDKESVYSRKKTNNKELSNKNSNINDGTSKRIKEVVIFFEDGTYQKFSQELKK